MQEEYRRLPLACIGGPLFAISEFWLVSPIYNAQFSDLSGQSQLKFQCRVGLHDHQSIGAYRHFRASFSVLALI
jgi:hypothetical protein